MLKKRHRSSVELLPHDVVELILERLPAKSLHSFKFVSKQWKSSIDSKPFQEKHLIHYRTQSRDPDVFFLSVDRTGNRVKSRRIELGSSIFFTLKLPFPANMVCYGTCDGLICMYGLGLEITMNIVANPATKWHRSFPLSQLQHLIVDLRAKRESHPQTSNLGFGKDKFNGTYKPVWLYNSFKYGQDKTICEVFDFTTNAWRYVLPASPYGILPYQNPVYFDGSLHWLTDCKEAKVLSFDLHAETFQVLCKAPFAQARPNYVIMWNNVIMCVLDNRLCVSQINWPTQAIWSLFDSSIGNKTWKKICCIDLTETLSWFGYSYSEYALLPVAILKKNKLLLHGRQHLQPLVIHDLFTKSHDLVFKPTTTGYCSYYSESLLSI